MSVQSFTLYDMLVRNAAIFADRPAVIHAQGQWTFRQFLSRVNALAAGLAALPICKGERICILAQNHPDYLALYGACARLGILAYPINWRLSPEEVEEVYASADIFVLSSVAEPFGLTPLEALSRAVPVIVSRQSGVAEVLESCPKYDSWDTRLLAEHVLSLSRSPALRRQLAEAGRLEIEGMRWALRAQALLDVYRELSP